jgi:hypothetical protein
MRCSALGVFILVCAMFGGCQNETASDDRSMQFDFERITVGSLATGWMAGETNSQGTPAMWRIIQDGFAPSPPHVIAVVANKNAGPTCNLLMANSGSYRDLELSAYIRPKTGSEEQGGGLFWRAQDTHNYYVARWNPLGATLSILLVKDGRTRKLASTTLHADASRWQKITVCQVENRISVSLNDDESLVVENKTLTQAGKVGLWIKADAVTSFDELSVKGLDSGLEQ